MVIGVDIVVRASLREWPTRAGHWRGAVGLFDMKCVPSLGGVDRVCQHKAKSA